MNREINRREALRRLGFGALGLSFPGMLSACADMRTNGGLQLGGPVESPFDRISPVDRFRGPATGFSGDNPEQAHALLWNKKKTMEGRRLKGHEEVSVAVVGGGMAGLISAYLLRDLKPVILEKSERMGGNSRGEAWEGVEYTIGAAYLSLPEKGSSIDELFRGAGVIDLCRKRSSGEPVLLDKKVYADFWAGQTDPTAAKQIERLRDFFLSYVKGDRALPNIPSEGLKDIPLIAEMDRFSFYEFLVHKFGEPLHSHAHAMLELYCWATLGCSIYEVSAAVAMNYYCAEFADVLVPPSGNSTVAERFLKLFLASNPMKSARAGSVVLDVSPHAEGVDITYFDRVGDLRQLRAKAVVMACPKFVAKKLLDGLEADRGEALSQLEYRSYVVANACLRRPPTRDLHDVYLLGNGEMPIEEVQRNQHNHGSADCTFANYGQLRKEGTVLTICHPLPFKGGREELLAPGAYERFSQRIRGEVLEQILPPLGYRTSDLAELRLTRWGHPIPFAKPGFYWQETPKALSKPFADRVFFVNQDNWAAPAIETCALEALKWMPKVRELL